MSRRAWPWNGGSDEIGGMCGRVRMTSPVRGSVTGTGGTTIGSWFDSAGTR